MMMMMMMMMMTVWCSLGGGEPSVALDTSCMNLFLRPVSAGVSEDLPAASATWTIAHSNAFGKADAMTTSLQSLSFLQSQPTRSAKLSKV